MITTGAGRTKRFQVECYKCGKKVNRDFGSISTCSNITQVQGVPVRRGNQVSGGGVHVPSFKCTFCGCGIRGHLKKYFWEDNANSRKRPEGWRSRNSGEHKLITNNLN